MAAIDRDGFAGLIRADGAEFSDEDVDAYWRPFAEGRGREATVEFYRSMDFEKLAPYDGKLAELGVPTLLVWGADDQFAPLAGAQALRARDPRRAPRRSRGRWTLRLRPGTRADYARGRRLPRRLSHFATQACGWCKNDLVTKVAKRLG